MTVIYIAFVSLALLVAVLAYTSRAYGVIKAIAIVGLVALGLGLEGHYKASLGKPIESNPPNGFIYIHHEIQGEDIIIWSWVKGVGHRLYVIPFDQRAAEELAEAQQQGTPQQGRFETDERGVDGDADSGLIFDDWVGDNTGETKGGE